MVSLYLASPVDAFRRLVLVHLDPVTAGRAVDLPLYRT